MKLDKSPSSEDIRHLRGGRSRAEFGALLGVTGLTVYRWELPEGASEARRPRGAVLRRLLAFAEREGARRPEPGRATPFAPESIAIEEQTALAPAMAAMNEGRLERAETALVSLLASGSLRSEAARALASSILARIQLLARHDTKGAFATLLAAGADVSRFPPSVQIEYHLTAAYLHAHSDAQLFLPGKTNHHAALCEPLIGEGHGDHRFFLWYARFTAAVALYDHALMARVMEGFAAVRELATSDLHRCLVEEAATLSSLGLTNTTEAAAQLERFRAAAQAHDLPLQQVRAVIWRAELSVEEAAAPEEILRLLDEAEHLQRRHRIAEGIHAMLMNRNRGEALLRLGRRHDAETSLHEADRIGRILAFTPVRIYTTLARLYFFTNRIDDASKLAETSAIAEDTQKDLTRGFGRVLAILVEVHRGDAAIDWCERVVDALGDLRRRGVWPIAYRHLALLSLAVGASKGGTSDAERLLAAAERAIEWSASPTASATYRRHQATVLLRRGRTTEARRALEAALATFTASGDVAEAALARYALANVDRLDERADAEARMREASAELARLELPAPPVLRRDAVHRETAKTPRRDDGPTDDLTLEALVVPLQRLATRGIGGTLLQKQLVAIVAELLPDSLVRLEHVDAAGRATQLEAGRTGPGTSLAWFELSDSAGHRLRLGVSEPLVARQRAAIEIVLAAATMAFEIAALRGHAHPAEPVPAKDVPDFVAASPSMLRLRGELGRLSGSRATIIVTGESGTGKEVVARAIHTLSRRAAGAYVTFNSAAVPRELFESQLFGHKRGAFTGATSDHAGVIRAADGGTLFLDEIGELPLDVQPKLLRFLENGEILPLGERAPVHVDVRVIAATHRDLLHLVREGKFREDLYYRLQVIPVNIPPLRDRREDVLALARNFIRRMTPPGSAPPVLTSDGEAKLLAHGWPGNVRELRNVIERAMAFDTLPCFVGAGELRLDRR